MKTYDGAYGWAYPWHSILISVYPIGSISGTNGSYQLGWYSSIADVMELTQMCHKLSSTPITDL